MESEGWDPREAGSVPSKLLLDKVSFSRVLIWLKISGSTPEKLLLCK